MPEIRLSSTAKSLYEPIRDLPIVSPHGHCDPAWWAHDAAFPNPAALLIQPDHYVFRMLYSQGVSLADLGIGPGNSSRDPREVFRIFAAHWHLFAGTPSRQWLSHTFEKTLGVTSPLAPETADEIYDHIDAQLTSSSFRPRALFDAFNISCLATTDPATATLDDHKSIAQSDWGGRVIPTFRPDDLLNPARAGHCAAMQDLQAITGYDVNKYTGFLDALRARRAAFKEVGATATDHDVPNLRTLYLGHAEIEALHAKVITGSATDEDSAVYYAHMLTEMAQMSVEDGLVMQIHAGSRRNTNNPLFAEFGPDMGSDIPAPTNWVDGMAALLNRVGK